MLVGGINNLIITECDMGSFGQNCGETCSIHCQEPGKCDHVDGSCMCQSGWKGEDCKQGKVQVCQVPERCEHVDDSCMCQPGYLGKIVNKVKLKYVRNQRSVIM